MILRPSERISFMGLAGITNILLHTHTKQTPTPTHTPTHLNTICKTKDSSMQSALLSKDPACSQHYCRRVVHAVSTNVEGSRNCKSATWMKPSAEPCEKQARARPEHERFRGYRELGHLHSNGDRRRR